jgi:hypothetical protein
MAYLKGEELSNKTYTTQPFVNTVQALQIKKAGERSVK